jgi:hypothetical protein
VPPLIAAPPLAEAPPVDFEPPVPAPPVELTEPPVAVGVPPVELTEPPVAVPPVALIEPPVALGLPPVPGAAPPLPPCGPGPLLGVSSELHAENSASAAISVDPVIRAALRVIHGLLCKSGRFIESR